LAKNWFDKYECDVYISTYDTVSNGEKENTLVDFSVLYELIPEVNIVIRNYSTIKDRFIHEIPLSSQFYNVSNVIKMLTKEYDVVF